MNYLITLNINNYLSPNVRDSYLSACSRWGVSFYEITNKYTFEYDMCFNKILGIKDLINTKLDVRGVLYLDSDMLIREDAPNPFELFNNRKRVYVVKDFDSIRWAVGSESYYAVKNEVSTPWIKMIDNQLKWNMSSHDINNCVDWFFNAGMFLLYTPESMAEIDLFISSMHRSINVSRCEQALWNYILKLRNKLEYIDPTWNRINPILDSGNMNSFIYHFTGMESFGTKVKNRQKDFSWKLPITSSLS